MFTEDQIQALAANLPKALVKQRQGFSYIEGHEAIRACNRIFGFGNWQRNEPRYERVMDEVYGSEAKPMYRVGYTCKLSVTVWSLDRSQSITTWGTGYGEQITSDNTGKAHEGAIKEAETDAMKRALIALGDQFGLALYDKDQRHVGGTPVSEPQPDTSHYPPEDQPAGSPPRCPVHNLLMKPGKNGGYFCSAKTNGEWCKERAQ